MLVCYVTMAQFWTLSVLCAMLLLLCYHCWYESAGIVALHGINEPLS